MRDGKGLDDRVDKRLPTSMATGRSGRVGRVLPPLALLAGLLFDGQPARAQGAPDNVPGSTAGDTEVLALTKKNLRKVSIHLDPDKAKEASTKALDVCKKKGCSPAVLAGVYEGVAAIKAPSDGYGALQALESMLRADPSHRLTPEFAADKLLADLFKTAKTEIDQEVAEKAEEEQLQKQIAEREAARKKAEAEREAVRKKAEAEKEAVRKKAEAEEERKRRLKEPPPLAPMIEKPWTEQAVGTPIPVFVRVPPPLPNIEPERWKVAKVELEYMTSSGVSTKVPMKPYRNGFSGLIPCAAVAAPGDVMYWTTAYSTFGFPLATGGSSLSPNTVLVKPSIAGGLPHNPGELPPEPCGSNSAAASSAGGTSSTSAPTSSTSTPASSTSTPASSSSSTSAPKGDECTTDVECTEGKKCIQHVCGGPAPAIGTVKKRGMCGSCMIHERDESWLDGRWAPLAAAFAAAAYRRRAKKVAGTTGGSAGHRS